MTTDPDSSHPTSPSGVSVAIAQPVLLGESPMWHPVEQVLYYCDVPGKRLHRFDPATRQSQSWAFDTELACCAAAAGGGLVLALRSGFWRFDPSTGVSHCVAAATYDTATERFNDGKCDAAGRFWVGTIPDSRKPVGGLYCLERGVASQRAGDVCNSNGLAFSPDNRTMYWADTTRHTVFALDFDLASGAIGNKREFARFALRGEGESLATYGGRPDGAAVDVDGNYWVSLFEGQRVVQLSPRGELLREIRLPVRCPTMPCFGGADLKTLYITTSREKRPADELAAQPDAGCVLQMRVDVAGLPSHLYID
jgi:sugar lactone lactonase YvrE